MSGDADLLRRAARWVRDAAGRAQGASWDWRRDREFPFSKWRIVDEQDESVAALMGAHPGADAEWVSVFGPQLAEPLAAWLQAAADDVFTDDLGAGLVRDVGADQRAVAMARALLGETA